MVNSCGDIKQDRNVELKASRDSGPFDSTTTDEKNWSSSENHQNSQKSSSQTDALLKVKVSGE